MGEWWAHKDLWANPRLAPGGDRVVKPARIESIDLEPGGGARVRWTDEEPGLFGRETPELTRSGEKARAVLEQEHPNAWWAHDVRRGRPHVVPMHYEYSRPA